MTSVSIATLGPSLHAGPAFAQTVSTPASASIAGQDTAIRPFRVNVPEAALIDLRRRIAATRWPERETVNDHSQGVQLEKLKALVRYWGTDYDWRKAEAKLNALPQFVTTIDGLDIHFIHVRSRHPNAMPLIMTHGWPGSVFELLKVVDPLDRSHGPWRTRGRRLPSRAAVVSRAMASRASPTEAGVPTASRAHGTS